MINCLRYYFGFLIFYFLFLNNFKIFKLDILLLLLYSLTFIEFLYLNLIDFGFHNITLYLNNFPPCILIEQSSGCNYEYKSFNLFQRPHGFAANSGISSIILIALMSLNNKKSVLYEILLFMTIFILASGTGYFFYFLYLFNKFKRNYLIMILLIVLVLLSLFFFQKYSLLSIISLFNDKYINLFKEFNVLINPYNIYILSSLGKYGGDFAISFFIQNFGLISVLIILFFIFKQINLFNYFSITIIIISSFHYGTPFSIPGQIVLGYCLAYKNNTFNRCFELFSLARFFNIYKSKKYINLLIVILIILISIFDYQKKQNLNLFMGPQKEGSFLNKDR